MFNVPIPPLVRIDRLSLLHNWYDRILPNIYTSRRRELYPNSQKMMPSTNASNKYEMRRVGLYKLVALSCVKAQHSNWRQMTLTISHQGQKWTTNPGWKRRLARCRATSRRQELYSNSQKWCHAQYEQQIWGEEGRSLEASCPILCQSPIQSLATDDSHNKLPSAKVSNKFGVEEESYKMSCCCEWLVIDVISSPRIYHSMAEWPLLNKERKRRRWKILDITNSVL